MKPSHDVAQRLAAPGRARPADVTELIRRRKRYPALLGQHFNRTLQLRLDADYRFKGVSQRQATQAVRWTEAFVATITAEVSHGTDNPDTP